MTLTYIFYRCWSSSNVHLCCAPFFQLISFSETSMFTFWGNMLRLHCHMWPLSHFTRKPVCRSLQLGIKDSNWPSQLQRLASLKIMSCLMTKPTKWHMHPAKTQISLDIHPVWSESSLSAWRKLGSLATYWVHSKDSDQTGWIPK